MTAVALPSFMRSTPRTWATTQNQDRPNQLTTCTTALSRRRPPPTPPAFTAAANGDAAAIRPPGQSIAGSPAGDSTLMIKVAYQGVPGAYSESAARTVFPGCTAVPCRTFSDAVLAVDRGLADRAIIPVENTMDGTSLRNYDLLLRHDLRIAREVSLFVHYCLLAIPGVRRSQVRRVISHPTALAHCGRAIAAMGAELEVAEDTAGAVEMLRSRRILDAAAIASPRAASIYGLDVLDHGLQDESWNVTRFLVLSRPPEAADRSDLKTSVAMAPGAADRSDLKTSMVIAHRGGSTAVILQVLRAFSSRGVNLSKLELMDPAAEGKGGPVVILDVAAASGGGGKRFGEDRMTMRKGTLRAFPRVICVDFEGSPEEMPAREAIESISEFSVMVRILGCYAADSNIYDLLLRHQHPRR